MCLPHGGDESVEDALQLALLVRDGSMRRWRGLPASIYRDAGARHDDAPRGSVGLEWWRELVAPDASCCRCGGAVRSRRSAGLSARRTTRAALEGPTDEGLWCVRMSGGELLHVALLPRQQWLGGFVVRRRCDASHIGFGDWKKVRESQSKTLLLRIQSGKKGKTIKPVPICLVRD